MEMKDAISLVLCCAFLIISPKIRALDYYWIGGSGNWSDISHWATTSGGPITHNQAPTAEDDVIFDANSFNGPNQTVTIVGNAFCRTMRWTGVSNNPTLTGAADGVLNIYGSLRLVGAMTFSFQGDVRFLSQEAGQEVDLASHFIAGSTVFEGVGGEWRLLGPLTVNNSISLVNGTLNTSGQNVTCNQFSARAEESGALNLGSSRLSVLTSGNPSLRINGAKLSVDAASAIIDLGGTDAEMVVEGNTAIQFNEVRFSSTVGGGLLKCGNPSSFKKVSFASNGTLEGSQIIERLELTEGRIYRLESNQTFEIGELVAIGQCVAPIQLFSSNAGAAAIIQPTGGPVVVDYVSLKDIHVMGLATYRATNSADLGNNMGWDIAARPNNSLYWVGGTGSWDDPAHWSFTSGGPGGACIPTGADNVFFDANSFDGPSATVTINIQNAFCRDMTWTGATGTPILAGDMTNNLRVYGSLTFIPGMELLFEGDTYFESPRLGNAVTTANHLFIKDVFFNGFNGGWDLRDSLLVTNNLYLVQGSLDTRSQGMACSRFLSEDPNPRQLTMGSTHLRLGAYGNGFSRWVVDIANLEFDAGTSLLEFATNGDLITNGSGDFTYHDVVFDQNGYMSGGDDLLVNIESVLFEQSGTLFKEFRIGTLELTKGYEYNLDNDKTQFIGELIANGDCEAYIHIRSSIDDRPANITSDRDNNGTYLILKDIHNTGPTTFQADNSVDVANNQGWIIDNTTGRTLYWVGGTGDWEDRNHWSLSSGGPGGECIPTPVDDVIFDGNSFDGTGQIAYGLLLPEHYCRNMTWVGAAFEPQLDMANLQLYGSLELIPEMTTSIGQLELRSDQQEETLLTAGQPFNTIIVEGSGSWRLLDELAQAEFLQMINGTFYSNDQPMTIGRFQSWREETPKRLVLGSSAVTVTSAGNRQPSWDVLLSDFSLDAGNSVIDLTDPKSRMRNRIPLAYNDVLFTATTDESVLETTDGQSCEFNLVRFNKDGTILGANVFDTLIFSPGKAYRLEAGQTQTIVEHWQIYGNNCSPIQLSSTKGGVQSTAFMASGAVNGDFIQMRDQNATGDATFYAGIHSTDIGGSNTGWIFESDEPFIDVGFLGTDVVLCNDDQVVSLDANNNSNDETYLWQDGSTASTFTTQDPGTYFVEVTFGNDCEIRDSVIVLPPEAFQVQLTPDTVLCDGENLLLDATFPAKGVAYSWQDGSMKPTFRVKEAGEFSVVASLSGCTASDTVAVNYNSPPQVELGENQTLCYATTLSLEASSPDAESFLWQDSLTTTAAFTVDQPGVYWVDAFIGRCANRDSVTVDYLEAIAPDLGADTLLCEGEQYLLEFPKEGASFAWSDGSTGATLAVSEAGGYWVDVTLEGCTERDSVFIDYKPLPAFDLGADETLCVGEDITLNGDASNDDGTITRLWSDGSTGNALLVDTSGLYWLEADLNGCIRRDSVQIDYVVLPPTDLGQDTVLCEGQELRFDITVSGANYEWQDGSGAPFYTVRSEGLYWAQVNIGRCSDRDSVNVRYKSLPQISIGNDTTICETDSYTLNLQTNGDTFRWLDGSQQRTLEVSDPGLYWAEATLDGCTARDTAIIEFQMSMAIDLGPDTTICHDATYRLDPGLRADGYLWQDGSTDPTLVVNESGTYTIEMYDGACVLRDSVRVTVEECTYFRAYIPNAISPNGDGVNDVLQVFFPSNLTVAEFAIRIFDRWGNLVFESKDPDMAWGGDYRSQTLPGGVYIYALEVEYIDDRGSGREVITGDVSIVK